MSSSASRSVLRSTVCMQTVDLKAEIATAIDRSPSTISRELRRNSRPSKVWRGGYEPVRAQQLAERRRRWDGRFKLARQVDLRNRVGKSLAMGHSPEQIAGRLALQHGRVIISHEFNLSFYLSSCGPEGLLASPVVVPETKTRASPAPRSAVIASFIKHRRSISERPAEVEGRGVPGHWEADFMLFARMGRGCCCYTSEKPASTSPAYGRSNGPPHRPGHRSSTWEASTGNLQDNQLRQRKRVRRASQTSSRRSASRPTSAIRIARGKRAEWKTPSAACDVHCRARPTSSSSPPAALERLVQRLNNTPRKCLDFKTPAEAFSKLKSTVANVIHPPPARGMTVLGGPRPTRLTPLSHSSAHRNGVALIAPLSDFARPSRAADRRRRRASGRAA